MKAQVIAYTQFIGVPQELWPDLTVTEEERVRTGARSPYSQQLDKIEAKGQDRGKPMERLIECAGRACYDSYGKGRSSDEYHKHILEVGHGSVLAHACLSFFLSGVSRGLTHELVRHAIGIGISQRSTRYVDESESDWQWHPLIAELIRDEEETELEWKQRRERCEMVARDTYQWIEQAVETRLQRRGIDRTNARKQARGAARGALGNALETSLVWTCNVRALRHVLEQRASSFADAEIRLEANAIYEAAYEYVPAYLSDYVKVPCEDGLGYALITNYRKV